MKSKSEKHCKESLERYVLSISPHSIINWEDVEKKNEPPDYYLVFNGKRFAVEITQIVRKEIVGTKTPLPASIIRDLLHKFVSEEVEAVARDKGILRGSYTVYFTKPIFNFSIVKDKIQLMLLNYISDTQYAIQSDQEVVYKHGREECRVRKSSNLENKVIMGGPTLSMWMGEAPTEFAQLIDERLVEKRWRLRNINDPKILLLHNKYPFVIHSGDIKICPLDRLSTETFHAVFLIYANMDLEVLHLREPL